MEDLDDLMVSSFMFMKQVVLHNSLLRFDKGALLQLHEDCGRPLRGSAANGSVEICSSVMNPRSSTGTACSVPLERLNPISFNELQVGKIHRGRVVYGTLSTEANRICGIMTLLEDHNGLAVRLEIYNVAPSRADIKKLYPRGVKVAVKEPYFKISMDGGLLIRVENPANVVKQTENLLHLDVEEVGEKVKKCFREQNWDAAAEHYTKCIDAYLLHLKEGSYNLLRVYSNRAETWLQMKEFKWALDDSNDALRIDPC